MWSFLIVVYDITVYGKSWCHTMYGRNYDCNAYAYKSCIVSANLSPSHCLWEMDRLLSKLDANAREAMRAHDISDIEVLLSLNTDDLREMGLSVGARKKIQLLQKESLMLPMMDSVAGSSSQPHVAINSVSICTQLKNLIVWYYMHSHTHDIYILYIYITFVLGICKWCWFSSCKWLKNSRRPSNYRWCSNCYRWPRNSR